MNCIHMSSELLWPNESDQQIEDDSKRSENDNGIEKHDGPYPSFPYRDSKEWTPILSNALYGTGVIKSGTWENFFMISS